MIKIALIGCGRIGQMHADNVNNNRRARLHSVYDSYTPAAERVAAQQGVAVADSVDAIFTDTSVDAVLIASATDTHADYLELAVEHNKPALCEKPIDLSFARVNSCADKIAGSKTPIQLGFNRRFDPGHRQAQAALRAGAIGELRQMVITSRDPELPPEQYLPESGGLFRDMTIHDFDVARFMLGSSEPVKIFAHAERLVDAELMQKANDYDSAMFILSTADGKICHINNSRSSAYGYDQRIELLGSDGMLISDNRKPHETRKYSSAGVEDSTPYLYFFIERYHQAYVAELDAFVECVQQGSQPEVGFEDGRRALAIAEAAYRSLQSGAMVDIDY